MAVKITAKNRDGKEIFTNPMLLITNKSVTTGDEALSIYLNIPETIKNRDGF